MGAYLSQPRTEKDSHEGENSQYKYGVTGMQGWRTEMEDAHTAVLNVVEEGGATTEVGFFGVFDGHGGREVARFAAKHLVQVMVRTDGWKAGNLEVALSEAYLALDDVLKREAAREELRDLAKEPEEPRLDEIPDYVRDAIAGQIKDHRMAVAAGADGDEDWSGDEFEDPAYDPLVEFDESAPGSKVGETDVMTRDDSDAEEDSTHDSTQDESHEGSSEKPESPSADNDPDDRLELGYSNALWPEEKAYVGPAAGCTAVVAVVKGDILIVANAGDSRCVASRLGEAVAMTNDHKPTDTEECARIRNAGGLVIDGRVNGSLNLSRALGDMEFKQAARLPPAQQMITAFPEVRTLKLQPGDEFIVLACDGIWDVLTNQQAVEFVRERLMKGMDPRAICEAMCDACLAPDTSGLGQGCDNMSAMVVVLKGFSTQEIKDNAIPVPPPWP